MLPGCIFYFLLLASSESAPTGEMPQRLALDLHYSASEDAPAPMAERRLHPRHSRHRGAALRRLRASNSHPCDLHNYDNVQYHLKIRVGTPCAGSAETVGQRFVVVPDTGSSELWIPAGNCTGCTHARHWYDFKASCSAKALGDPVHLQYGDGTDARGIGFSDTLEIEDLKVKNQFMIMVDKMQADANMTSDGILGLAHRYKFDRESGETFMAMLFKDHPNLPHMFSFYMTGSGMRKSQLIFGTPDLVTHAKEDQLHYGNGRHMQTTDLWLSSVSSIGLSGTGVKYNFTKHGRYETSGAPALIDSGTSLIVLSAGIYDLLIHELSWRMTGCRQLPDKQITACDCPPANDLSRMPSLSIMIVGEEGDEYPLCLSPDEYILESLSADYGESTCVPAFQRGDVFSPYPLILGMTFLRSFYTNFDMGAGRIGFARSNMSPLPAGATCDVDEFKVLRRATWLVAVFSSFVSAFFAAYVLAVPEDVAKGKGYDPSEKLLSDEEDSDFDSSERNDEPL